MADFSVQIRNFKNNGTYDYLFDSVGNEILNPSSSIFQQNYISFPTVNYDYDNLKIASFYNPTFTEFIPQQSTSSVSTISQAIADHIDSITQQNETLQNQLDTLISRSETNSTSADIQMIKDIILTLRIQLGQGTSAIDFYTDFPYLPIPLDKRVIP